MYTSEQRMWMYVLIRAIMDAQGLVGCIYGGTKNKKIIREIIIQEAKDWLCSTSTDVCSFYWICEVLDLSAEAILEQLERKGVSYVIKKYTRGY